MDEVQHAHLQPIRVSDPTDHSASDALVAVLGTSEVLANMGSARALSTLDEAQLRRWQTLQQRQDRNDFLAARLLTRRLVGTRLGYAFYDGPIVQRCDVCPQAHGRPLLPELPSIHVSWSHTHGVVAAVVATRPVGVDVERVRPEPPALTTGAMGSHREQWLSWTRMESLVKLGFGDLDTALTWPLTWGETTEGHLFVRPSRPEATHDTGPNQAWICDLPSADGGIVASVAQLVSREHSVAGKTSPRS